MNRVFDWSVDELVAYLNAHPDVAVGVVRKLDVIGPWKGAHRYDLHSEPVTTVYQASIDPEQGAWVWVARPPGGLGDGGRAPSEAEARTAADAVLTAAGWALASGGVS